MTNNQKPLVSIVIITYNSSEYVLETLESAKQQTYENIELIVSDDCSTDNTVAICREWLEKNKSRFVRAELIVVEHNTGIPANCNRGCKKAQGEFIKIIAGDDILLPNCIEDLVNAIGDEFIITGICHAFFIDNNGKKTLRTKYPIPNEPFFNFPSHLQHKKLLIGRFPLSSPTILLRKELFEKIGYFDERYHYIEDLPFLLKCTSAGFKITLLPKTVVLYRTRHDSMVQRKTTYYNTQFYECVLKFTQEYVFPRVPWYNFAFWETEFMRRLSYHIIVKICNNKRNSFTKAIRAFFYLIAFRAYFLPKIKEYINTKRER